MKKYSLKNIFVGLASLLMLPLVSCKDDTFLNYDSSEDGEYVNVAFSLAPESAMSTRATEALIKPEVISGGSHIDKLIYAVYVIGKDENNNDTYTIYPGYSNDPENTDDHGEGQTVKEIDKFPYPFHITLKRGVDYMIAFWAQSSETEAFDTHDLRKVEVKYNIVKDESKDSNEPSEIGEENQDGPSTGESVSSVKNNDDFRDAFCRRVKISVPKSGSVPQQNIYLYRPFAQINVGTTGYDYEAVMRNSSKKFTYSKIRLNRVARYLDICEDRTYVTTTKDDPYGKNEGTVQSAEAFAVVDFGYALIPAYNHMDKPEDPSYTLFDWTYDTGFSLENLVKQDYEKEEFLRVKRSDYRGEDGTLNLEGKAGTDYPSLDEEGYVGYANHNNFEGKASETFKYLSMCYVLTASTEEKADVLNNIKVWLATDENGTDETEILNINQVSAQKNWRTNIIGNILTEVTSVEVSMDRNFAGEYNGIYSNNNAEWTGQIADGVYYNGEKDVIEISNRNGLLWFQRMVNGKLIGRENTTQYENKEYPYYDLTGQPLTLSYKSYDYSDFSKEVSERIFAATHIKENSDLSNLDPSTGWPLNNNFNFLGATIRLMADIDLSGIEWIPIGFDIAVHDTSIADNLDGNNKKIVSLDYHDVLPKHGKRRLFCGVFDGNGHTIYNLKNKRFGAMVSDQGLQKYSQGPYDNVQWFPAGFFGMVGGDAEIKNLTLTNVDIFGYHTAAAIAAVVNSHSSDVTDYGTVKITNCKVSGGQVILSPMYRGDTHKEEEKYTSSRTFARGIYGGAIAGQWVAKGEISGCEVSNVTVKGYRQIGGLVGSISNSENTVKNETGETTLKWQADFDAINNNLKISGNSLYNVTVIADKFQPYDVIQMQVTNGFWRNGFGWRSEQASLANKFVGGTKEDQYADGNSESGTVFTELSTQAADDKNYRESIIHDVPLKYFPILSSWFCDNITLTSNYYGEAPTYSHLESYWYKPWTKVYNDDEAKFNVPFDFPFDLSVQYDKSSPKAGMYVESVELDGSGNTKGGNRSVITPSGITGNGACVLYITSRNRKQFFEYWEKKGVNKPSSIDNDYTKATKLSNLVLRGDPYAWAGIVLAPNENMSEVELNNVNIYDVYRTLSLDAESSVEYKGTNWTNASDVKLTVKNSNLRGYTVPGAGWGSITYNEVTFEEGTKTGQGGANDYKTLRVDKNATEGKTTFTKCFFKAPYIIEIDKDANVVFDAYSSSESASKCKATGAAEGYVQIYLNSSVMGGEKCTKIEVNSDVHGNPLVYYTLSNGKKYDKDWKTLTE